MSATENVHGLHAVQALLERHADRVLKVMVARGRDDARITAVLAAASRSGVSVERVEAQRLEKLAGNAVHQGVIAEVRPMAPWSEDDLGAAIDAATSPSLVLALDGVQDPHNLGACLRTADACGALSVVIPKDRAAQLNATVRKVAAGAAETTPLTVVTNLSRALRELKERGLWVIGADASAPKRADEVELTGPVVIVMGAEGSGLRHNTREHCDLLVKLPSLGAVESLNVSVATGMLLYEAVRQRQGKAR